MLLESHPERPCSLTGLAGSDWVHGEHSGSTHSRVARADREREDPAALRISCDI